MVNPNKKVNVKDKEKDIILRTTYSYAVRLVAAGTHEFTTKAKLRSFMKNDLRISKNKKTLAKAKSTKVPQYSSKLTGIVILPKRKEITIATFPYHTFSTRDQLLLTKY